MSRSADSSANAPTLATSGIGLAVAGIFWVADDVLDEVLELLGSGEAGVDEAAGVVEAAGVAVDASAGVLGVVLDGVVELELYVFDGFCV